MLNDIVTTAVGQDTSFLKKACTCLIGYGLLKVTWNNILISGLEKRITEHKNDQQCTKISIAIMEAIDPLDPRMTIYDRAVQESCKAIHFLPEEKQRLNIAFVEKNEPRALKNIIILPTKIAPDTLPITEEGGTESIKFVMAHELIHLKERHIKWKNLVNNIIIPPLCYFSIHAAMNVIDHIVENIAENSDSAALKSSYSLLRNTIFKSKVAHFFTYCAIEPLFENTFNQYLEKRADMGAVQGLQNAQGGIEFLKFFKEHSKKPSIFMLIKNYLLCNNEHPSPAQRIAYLERWQKEQELRV